VVRAATVAMQRRGKHTSTTIERLCFLRGPCRGVILKTFGATPVRDLHTAFNLPYVYVYITKLCSQHAEVIQNHENEHVRSTGQGETRHRKYKRLKLGGGQAYD
jgi:hypothetical protein